MSVEVTLASGQVPPSALEKEAVRLSCARSLVLHGTPAPAAWLAELARSPHAQLPSDVYATGGAVAVLEERVAALLGTPTAAFFTKGVAAQLAALKVWNDRAKGRVVALHPLSHIALDEDDAPAEVIGIQPSPTGVDRPFTAGDLEALRPIPDVVSYELPLRRAGFLTPTWDELIGVSRWCGSRGVPLHIDGARLWEVAPAYGRSLAEVAALADSVYLSLYKGLGAPSGAVLVGSTDFVAEAKRWRLRLGAQPFRNFPAAVGALDGLDRRYPRMPLYLDRARSLAARLLDSGLDATPKPPMCNGFRLRFTGAPERLEAAHLAHARKTGVWWFNKFFPDGPPDRAYAEIMIGDGADQIDDAEIVETALALQLSAEPAA